jgi:hypothetical protein
MVEAAIGFIGVLVGVLANELRQLRRERRIARTERVAEDAHLRTAARVVHSHLHFARVTLETMYETGEQLAFGPPFPDPADWGQHLDVLAERLSTAEWRKLIEAQAGVQIARGFGDALSAEPTAITPHDADAAVRGAFDAVRDAEAVLEPYAVPD